MRSPSIVPGFDVDVYLVLDDFGRLGRAYRETDEEKADRRTIIRGIMEGSTTIPFASSPSGWSRDVTEDIAREIKDHADPTGEDLSAGVRDFIDYQLELSSRYA
jgi:hypothetical protein